MIFFFDSTYWPYELTAVLVLAILAVCYFKFFKHN